MLIADGRNRTTLWASRPAARACTPLHAFDAGAVESAPVDLLLDHLPWSLTTVALPWLAKPIAIDWPRF